MLPYGSQLADESRLTSENGLALSRGGGGVASANGGSGTSRTTALLQTVASNTRRVMMGLGQVSDENQQTARIQQAVNRYNGNLPQYCRSSAAYKCSLLKANSLKTTGVANAEGCESTRQNPETRYIGAGTGHLPLVFFNKNVIRPIKKHILISKLRSDAPGLPASRFLDDTAEKYTDAKSTRSVLEVLHDLSRKRIHGKDEIEETGKRRCKGLAGDVSADGQVPYSPLFVPKRKLQSPKKDQTTQTFHDESREETPDSLDKKTEIRKRLARKNNEILASLSSSMNLASLFTKRKRDSDLPENKEKDDSVSKKQKIQEPQSSISELPIPYRETMPTSRSKCGPRSPPTKDQLMRIYWDMPNSAEMKRNVLQTLQSNPGQAQFKNSQSIDKNAVESEQSYLSDKAVATSLPSVPCVPVTTAVPATSTIPALSTSSSPLQFSAGTSSPAANLSAISSLSKTPLAANLNVSFRQGTQKEDTCMTTESSDKSVTSVSTISSPTLLSFAESDVKKETASIVPPISGVNLATPLSLASTGIAVSGTTTVPHFSVGSSKKPVTSNSNNLEDKIPTSVTLQVQSPSLAAPAASTPLNTSGTALPTFQLTQKKVEATTKTSEPFTFGKTSVNVQETSIPTTSNSAFVGIISSGQSSLVGSSKPFPPVSSPSLGFSFNVKKTPEKTSDAPLLCTTSIENVKLPFAFGQGSLLGPGAANSTPTFSFSNQASSTLKQQSTGFNFSSGSNAAISVTESKSSKTDGQVVSQAADGAPISPIFSTLTNNPAPKTSVFDRLGGPNKTQESKPLSVIGDGKSLNNDSHPNNTVALASNPSQDKPDAAKPLFSLTPSPSLPMTSSSGFGENTIGKSVFSFGKSSGPEPFSFGGSVAVSSTSLTLPTTSNVLVPSNTQPTSGFSFSASKSNAFSFGKTDGAVTTQPFAFGTTQGTDVAKTTNTITAPSAGFGATTRADSGSISSPATTSVSSTMTFGSIGATPFGASSLTFGDGLKTLSSSQSQPTLDSTKSLGFGSIASNLLNPSPTPSFGKAGITNAAAPTFGSATGSVAPAFGISTAASNPTFGAVTTASNQTFGAVTTASNQIFGAAAATSNPLFGAVTTTSNPTFSAVTTASNQTFGAAAATSSLKFGSVTITSNPTFGTTTTTPAPSFGSTTISAFGTTTGAPAPTFGSNSTPSFGIANTVPVPSFGSTSSSAFGAAMTTATMPAPAFGPAATEPTLSFGAKSNIPTSTFGSSLDSNTSLANRTFGAVTNASNPTFGTVTTMSTPAFGTNAAKTQSFGASTTTPAFGTAFTASTTSSSNFGAGTTPAFGTGTSFPVFGSASFGSANSTNAPPAYGTIITTKTSPGFGTTVATSNSFGTSTFSNANPPPPPPAYGTTMGTTSVSSFGFPFGSQNNASGGANTVGVATFGSSAPTFGPATSSLAFGAPTTIATTTPSFGSGSVASPFGASSSNTVTSFGATPAAPSFGASSASTGSVPFAFGPSPASAPSSVFSFGTSAPNTASPSTSAFAFGSGNASSAGSSMFNFGASSASSTGGAFSFAPSTNTAGTPGSSGLSSPFGTPTPPTGAYSGMFSIGSSSRPRATSRMRRKP